MAIPLEWKASIFGAEDVKAKLAEIREQYKKGDIGVQEYAQKQTYLSRQLRGTNLSLGQQKSIFLATHPALNKLSQAMSIFGSISRSALSIMNALNLATIASNSFASQEFDLKMQILEVTKQLNQIGPETPENKAARDEMVGKLKELNAELENIREQAKAQEWNDLMTKLGAIGTAITEAFGGAITIAAILKPAAFKAALTTFVAFGGSLGTAIMSGLAKFFGVAAIVEFFSMMGKQLAGDKDIAQGWDAILEIFTKDIPMALGKATQYFNNFWSESVEGWRGFWLSIVQTLNTNVNTVIGGLEFFINAFIGVINVMIAAYNKVAKKLNLPKLTPLENVKLPRLETNTTSGGVQTVPLAGSAFSKSAGGAVVTIIVNGSILAEREVAKIADEALKQNLKRVGFG